MWQLICIVLIVILANAYNRGAWQRDSTDPPAPGKRSGLILYTDHATGVQYLKGGIFGGLSPRLNTDGTPVNIYK